MKFTDCIRDVRSHVDAVRYAKKRRKLIHVDVSVHQIIKLSYAHIEMNEEMFETSVVVTIKPLAVDVQFAIYELGLLLSFYRTLQTFV